MRSEKEKSESREEEKPQGETTAKEGRDRSLLLISPGEISEMFSQLEKEGRLEEFLEKACGDLKVVALLSYWEKWLERDIQNLLERTIERKKEIYKGTENPDSLPLGLEQRFSEEELELIFSNIGAIQLTFGCSKGCPFCGYDALPGVREYIPYSQLANLFKRYGKFLEKSRPNLYWASEPADYKDESAGKTYQDVHQLARLYANYSPHVTSAKIDDEWLKFLTSGEVDLPRISVFNMSQERIEEIEKQYGEQLITTGKGKSHIKGIGLSFYKRREEESESSPVLHGIGCMNGLLLTPRGLYNVIQSQISEKLPQGQYVVPFEGFSKREIKEGDSLAEVLSGAIVEKERFSLNRKGVRLITLEGSFYVSFDENGIITKVWDYKKILKGIEGTLRKMRGDIKLGDIKIEFIDFQLSGEERVLIEEWLSNINFTENTLVLINHTRREELGMDILDCYTEIEIPELKERLGMIQCHFSYELNTNKLIRIFIDTDRHRIFIKNLSEGKSPI